MTSTYRKSVIDKAISDVIEKLAIGNKVKDLETKIQSKTRLREVVICRQMIHYILEKHTSMSLQSIGLKIGDRDHATVLHSKRTILNLMDTDRGFKEHVQKIESIFLSTAKRNLIQHTKVRIPIVKGSRIKNRKFKTVTIRKVS